MKSIITTCADDCPDNSGMIAEVRGRPALVSVKGNPHHGFTRGYLCKRGYNTRSAFTALTGCSTR